MIGNNEQRVVDDDYVKCAEIEKAAHLPIAWIELPDVMARKPLDRGDVLQEVARVTGSVVAEQQDGKWPASRNRYFTAVM